MRMRHVSAVLPISGVRRKRRKAWCIACRGSGVIKVWLGIRPRTMKSVCGPCGGTGDGSDTEDDDPSNMNVRAGYLLGLASRPDGRLTDEDREMLRRASRSLCRAANPPGPRARLGARR